MVIDGQGAARFTGRCHARGGVLARVDTDQTMERGKGVYEKVCAACHQPNGEGIPGAFPALKDSKIAMGSMEGHLDIVVHGKAGTAMAAFGAQLNEVDMAAVITYERNAWGNNVGDMLQPIDVANFKKGK